MRGAEPLRPSRLIRTPAGFRVDPLTPFEIGPTSVMHSARMVLAHRKVMMSGAMQKALKLLALGASTCWLASDGACDTQS
jgi:hypothetical protein